MNVLSLLQTVVGELYGPLMLVFTLIAVLLFSMKSSGHTVVSTCNDVTFIYLNNVKLYCLLGIYFLIFILNIYVFTEYSTLKLLI